MAQLTNKMSLGGGDLGGKIGTVSGSNNHVLDLSVGIKAIIGINVSLKIGLTGKQENNVYGDNFEWKYRLLLSQSIIIYEQNTEKNV
ncbi:hypothetical protein [Myroides odoratus]|uniref:hypothetical protein n=1 Tax=Myroides odoratus TaxID=256 RepID=UPI00333FE6EB